MRMGLELPEPSPPAAFGLLRCRTAVSGFGVLLIQRRGSQEIMTAFRKLSDRHLTVREWQALSIRWPVGTRAWAGQLKRLWIGRSVTLEGKPRG